MGLIDTHTHLESFARNGTLPGALTRAREAGVEGMITIGTSADDWALYRDLAGEHRGFVHYTVGLHPCAVTEEWESAVEQIAGFWGVAQVSSLPDTEAGRIPAPLKPVALGECGLDRFHLPKDPAEAHSVAF